ncbi:MAG: chemotaxis protein CheW [Planctomycetota bacterium]|nr:chemotaxis protein CheW [Planctomycetota bacterium]
MFQDDELIHEFVVESSSHLAEVEGQLLQIEAAGADIDANLVNTVFRGIHSVKGAAGFLGLTVVNALAHSLENVLNMIRNRELIPTSPIVNAMLRAADQLRSLVDNVSNSNSVDVSSFVNELEAIADGSGSDAEGSADPHEQVIENSGIETERAIDSYINYDAALLKDCELTPEAVVATPAPPTISKKAPSLPAEKPAMNQESGNSQAKQARPADAFVRVNVALLDRLMNLAGELVLSRNQLLSAVSIGAKEGLENIASRVDQVTSELQETIMQTRMQPIGTIFSRFPRVVRDLSAKLGKECSLEIEGNEVEVDKTIVEAMGDPLTHLIRNSVDHGIERPEQRADKGKQAMGTIRLRAFHQAGKVCIRIEDDGGGMDPAKLKAKAVEKGLITGEQASMMTDSESLRLIFAPGFSTAAAVTDVSGRGVGMDVVRTNIEQLGGTVDIESTLNQGSAVHITLPLTLAIIPSMIIGCAGERYAIPQSSIAELVRVPQADMETKIGRVKGAEVLRLRGALLPLVRLDSTLGLRTVDEHSERPKSANILVLETGQMRYGLLVDTLHDNEEIVVKPLGKHVKELGYLAGATILGDGYVALILDVVGIAMQCNLRNIESSVKDSISDEDDARAEEVHRLLLFANHSTEQFAIPMAMVARIERIKASDVRVIGNQKLLIYRGNSLPLIRVEESINALPPEEGVANLFVIVFRIVDREVGLIAPILRDIRDIHLNMDSKTLREPGVPGSTVIDGYTTRLLDLFELSRAKHPEWFVSEGVVEAAESEEMPTILLAEDSDFFRNHVQRTLESDGYKVVGAVDGQDAWDHLQTIFDDIDLIITDIEMPRMNGLELAKAVRSLAASSNLPIIALTSLASEDDQARGTQAGIDEYQVKMDPARLMDAVRRMLAKT